MQHGEIYDLDNTIYRDPKNKNAIFLEAAIQAAVQLISGMSEEAARHHASTSYRDYGTDFAVFVEKFGLDESVVHPLYHTLAMEHIFADVQPDERTLSHFEDRVRAKVPFSIVTHGSQDWLIYALRKMGLDQLFDPKLLFAVDHPAINYAYKHQSLSPFKITAQAMGIDDLRRVRVFEDSRTNLRMAHSGGAETVLVHWGADTPDKMDGQFICRKVSHVSDYTI